MFIIATVAEGRRITVATKPSRAEADAYVAARQHGCLKLVVVESLEHRATPQPLTLSRQRYEFRAGTNRMNGTPARCA